MKIAFVAKYYESYIDQLQKNINDINDLSYGELIQKLHDDYFSMYNSYVNYLNKIPGSECILVIPNWELLQDKWMKENHPTDRKKTGTEIAIMQLREFAPDILFSSSNFEYYTDIIPFVKDKTKKIVTWISCPLPPNLDLSNIDHIFTLFPPHQKYFNSIGKPCTLTTAGFDAEILKKFNTTAKLHDVSFVGGIGKFHKKREKHLEYLVPKTGMKVWGYGFTSLNPLKNIAKQILSRFIYTKKYQGNAWGMKMFNVLHESKITFNCHGDIAKDHSVNMRLFEATGVGTLLITEYSKSIEEFFVPGKEIVCYNSKEDALNKIRYYLEHEDERLAIAKAGQQKTLNSYNYQKLSLFLYEHFTELLKK